MRRKDREVTDAAKIKAVISACHCCRLGFADEGSVYIVPLNFGFEERAGRYTFYFHGAKEGRKVELARRGGSVGFELDTGFALQESRAACGYSAQYQSVIGTGTISILENAAEKRRGLQAIMRHNTGKSDWTFPEESVNGVCILKLEVETLSCKEHE